MSISLNATQIRLFGFSPKYVWEQFTIDYPEVARKIRRDTVPLFCDFEDIEAKITRVSKKIIDDNKIDIRKYAAKALTLRNQLKVDTEQEVIVGKKRKTDVVGRFKPSEEEGEDEEFIPTWNKEVDQEMELFNAKERMEDSGSVEEYMELLEKTLKQSMEKVKLLEEQLKRRPMDIANILSP